ncbi:TVP38/TMEM64 family protein [Rubrobacter taiwanensis]|jgi:uncharacterized membrane protein YdjX (TVP38/TMEM64 family)|nr:VTT domain-containing protein [Rubrobacter taiwanensis]
MVLQSVVPPLPATPIQVAGGYVFGTPAAFAMSWAGIMLGSAICFGISRLTGRRFVVRSRRLARLDHSIQKHGAIIAFVAGLIPLISFGAVSYAAGLSGLSFWRFILAAALGLTPSTLAIVHLGGAETAPGIYAALGALAAISVAAYAYYRRLS